MAINDTEYKSIVGLDSLYVAEVIQDDADAYVAGIPEYFAPAVEASQAPTTNSSTEYADDKAYDSMVSEGETVVELGVTGIPLEMQAKVLGKRFDATTGRMYDYNGTPPYFALGFRSLKSNGSYVYFWFAKGRFRAPSIEHATKTDTPEPKIPKITYSALSTVHKFDLGGGLTESIKRVVGDEDADNFSAAGWFTQVQVPGVATPAALALSSSDPVDGASSVAVNSSITLTFNNKLKSDAVKNVVVVRDDGTAVAAAVTVDATGKIITIDPTSDLDASSTYIVAYGLVDIYGQNLQGAINFGTA